MRSVPKEVEDNEVELQMEEETPVPLLQKGRRMCR